MGLFTKVFGTYSQRELKSIYPIVDKITALEDEYKQLTDAELQAKTPEFKERLANGETLDDILPEAFAAVREAADRVLGMRPYPVQLVGGIVLHQGRIAEMKTGEGKTLVATLPAYLNALTGEGVHIVTVNDYLAKRDSEWMGKVHRFMGLTVGLIIHDMKKEERQKAYQADITYGTNNEMGFDYLRDNMALYANEQVQRGHAFAIVDEVDSILIDEARTPLIISGMGEKSTQLYDMAEMFAARLKKFVVVESDDKEEEATDIDADYVVDEKARSVTLTARGVKKAEEFFHLDNLSDPENSTIAHHINQAIKAHGIMKRDVDYVVKDGEVVIVDEFTGRLMFGRRYSEGLHQAIEAKEHLSVQRESKTLATITFQNYFRLYRKLSGMTGTALTEEEEFATIYALDIIEIPTNRPIARIDNEDSVYKTENGKYRAVIQQVKACHAKGQPVLVGTVSIEKNELLGKMLTREGIKHNLLNAKNHEREAEIVAQAGQFGAVTVATNMAGRGTDIMLGGNAEYMAKNDLRKAGLTDELIAEATGYAETDNQEILDARKLFAEKLAQHKAEISGEADKVRAAGGLFIIGTERHDSRRIDNQLRGRAGRQGDPGETRFYISLEDDLMRLFGGDRVTGMMERMNIDEDTPIENKMLSRPIARIDNEDSVYKTENGKYRAVIQQVKACHAKGQPVLVGTVSIEKNELLGKMLTREGIKHNLLNAKNHEREAEIVAQAGQFGAVTVATNMAGRGTDIMLGGNAEYMAKNDLRKAGLTDELIAEATGYAETDNQEILDARKLFAEKLAQHKAEISGEADKVRAAGGLFIIGTERHDSRRIDNQLRGRAGRQGDPGETRFYISLEDDLMRLFGGDRVTGMMERMNIDEDTPIENKMLSRAIEQAQTTVESRNFQARKSVLEYDDVMNKQREIIYGQRKQVLDGMDVKGIIMGMMESAIGHQVRSAFMGQEHLDMVQCKELLRGLEGVYFTKYTVKIDESQLPTLTEDDFIDMFTKAAADFYEKKEQEITPPVMRELERVVLLRVVDEYWMDHIDAMQDLRQGIRLRAYAQTNPVDAYKKESLEMFEEMIDAMKEETVRRLYSVRLRQNEEVKRERVASGMTENVGGDGTVKKRPTKVVKVGRNDLCPCGSGLKWKKCTCKEYHS